MRVLVCGGRDYHDCNRVEQCLLVANWVEPITCVIQGGARGADILARMVATKHHIPGEEFPALWDKYGRHAGPIRNQRMLDEGKPDLVIAFPGGAGTADMVRRAKAANIAVLEVAT